MDQVHVSGMCIIFKNKFGQKEERWIRSFGTTPNRNYWSSTIRMFFYGTSFEHSVDIFYFPYSLNGHKVEYLLDVFRI